MKTQTTAEDMSKDVPESTKSTDSTKPTESTESGSARGKSTPPASASVSPQAMNLNELKRQSIPELNLKAKSLNIENASSLRRPRKCLPPARAAGKPRGRQAFLSKIRRAG